MFATRVALLSLLVLTGCLAPDVPHFSDAMPEARLPALGPSVVLLLAPESAVSEVVGAVMDPTTNAPLSTRRLVVPATASSLDYAHYEGVREMSVQAGVSSDLFGGIEAGTVTHVSYDVTIHRTVFLAGEQAYDARSRCCTAALDGSGRLDPSCEAGHVVRAFIGSGTLRYLTRSASTSDVGLEGLEIHDGVSYRIERERRFTELVFAVEVAPSAPICEHAFCDQRDAGGTCTRCRALGRQSDLDSFSAPADAVLDVSCVAMASAAPARLSVRGDVVVHDCYGSAAVTLGVRSPDARVPIEIPSPVGLGSPITFARTVSGLTTTGGGRLEASLDVLRCECGTSSARCSLDTELELAVEEDY